jgi:hypothetical protein
MKSLFLTHIMILLAVVAFFICACDKNETNQSYDITGDWKVTSYENYETSTVITKTDNNTWSQYNNGDITVSFTENDSIRGIKVTNSFSGKYTTDGKGVIKISNMMQTEINEPEWGRLFDSIGKAETFEVSNNHLKIFYHQKMKSITFEKMNK